jgi:hypothetical protein
MAQKKSTKKSQMALGDTNRPKLTRHTRPMTARLYREYADWVERVERLAGSEEWMQSGLVPPGIVFWQSDWTPHEFFDEFKEETCSRSEIG